MNVFYESVANLSTDFGLMSHNHFLNFNRNEFNRIVDDFECRSEDGAHS